MFELMDLNSTTIAKMAFYSVLLHYHGNTIVILWYAIGIPWHFLSRDLGLI